MIGIPAERNTRSATMKIGIDLTALLPQATGVDNYLINIVRHLGQLDRANRYLLFTNGPDRHRFGDALPPNFTIIPLAFRPRVFRLAFQQLLLPASAAAARLDVVHSPAFIMPLYRGRQHHVLTVHDMTFFSMPGYHIPLRRSGPFRRAVLHSIRHASLVSVHSRYVRDEVLRFVPDLPLQRVRVIAPGVSDEFRPCPPASARSVARRLGITAPYILHVGTIEPRKNLSRLVESYRLLLRNHRADEHLVLAGRLGWDYHDLLAKVGRWV